MDPAVVARLRAFTPTQDVTPAAAVLWATVDDAAFKRRQRDHPPDTTILSACPQDTAVRTNKLCQLVLAEHVRHITNSWEKREVAARLFRTLGAVLQVEYYELPDHPGAVDRHWRELCYRVPHHLAILMLWMEAAPLPPDFPFATTLFQAYLHV